MICRHGGGQLPCFHHRNAVGRPATMDAVGHTRGALRHFGGVHILDYEETGKGLLNKRQ